MEQKSKDTIKGFGDEWVKFDQSNLSLKEHSDLYEEYFDIFPWKCINNKSIGFDLGCGSGRWAKLFSPNVGKLFCIEPSDALDIAKKNLKDNKNCYFIRASVEELPLEDNSMDFGYSLGVLHHISNTQEGLNNCVKKLKKDAPFLIYLYYKLETKPVWYRSIWKLSDILRKIIASLPFQIRYLLSQLIAFFVYWPLARISLCLNKAGINVDNIPLNSYKSLSFYTMRTDALDRFGTLIEKRFSKEEITEMMLKSGLKNIVFSSTKPYWCAVGIKSSK